MHRVEAHTIPNELDNDVAPVQEVEDRSSIFLPRYVQYILTIDPFLGSKRKSSLLFDNKGCPFKIAVALTVVELQKKG